MLTVEAGAMSSLKLDFVVYLGDPDEGKTIPSAEAIQKAADEHKGVLSFSEGVYGAIAVTKAGKRIAELLPDPVIQLVTGFVRAVPFVLDGEPETSMLVESETGYMFEPSGDDILLSNFRGDAYEPDEYLIERETMPLDAFAEQSIAMGERVVQLIKKIDPKHMDDDYTKTLTEFLDMAKSKFRTFRLERERGVRR